MEAEFRAVMPASQKWWFPLVPRPFKKRMFVRFCGKIKRNGYKLFKVEDNYKVLIAKT